MTKLRRFEFRSGNSNKFWEITSNGTELLTKWGRIGTDGQTKTKDFASQEALEKEYEKLVKQKVKKGYVEVKGEDEKEIKEEKEEIGKAVEKEEAKVKEPEPCEKVHLPHVNLEPRVEFYSLFGVSLFRKDSKPWEPIDLKDYWADIPFDLKLLEAGINYASTPQLAELTRKVVELLKAPNQPKEPFDPDVLAAAFVYVRSDIPFLTYWAHRVSCLISLEILLNSAHFKLDYHWQASTKTRLFYISHNTSPAWHRGHSISPTSNQQNWTTIRSLLNSAPGDQYTEAKQFAARRRESADLEMRCNFSFIFPDIREWASRDASDCIAADNFPANGGWLLSCLQDPELVESLVDRIINEDIFNENTSANLKSMVHLLGLKAENILKKLWKKKSYYGYSISQAYFHFKSPGAADFFVSLLDDRDLKKDALEYLQAYPELAIPALARTRKAFAEGLLSSLVRKHNHIVEAILPFLPETETNAIEKIRGKVVLTVPDAEDDQLPAILVTPPWKAQKIKKAKPVVVKDITPLDWPESIDWREQQHQEWSYASVQYSTPSKKGNQELLKAAADTRTSYHLSGYKLFSASDEVAVKVWNEVPPSKWYWLENDDLKQILARYQLKALPGLLAFAQSNPIQSTSILERVNSAKIAPIMAQVLVGSKSGRRVARNWLESFPKTAAVGLIPIAIGQPGTERNNAENALRYMAAKNQAGAIKEIAGKYGVKTMEVVETILDFDPLLDFPDKIAKMPDWWDPGSFTRPLLKDKNKALPIHALENLGAMLSFTPLSPPYQGINLVREIIDPASMFEFCWDLFTTWLAEDGKTKTDWSMMSLAHFGGDEAVRRLTPLIRSWPGESAHARATRGLELLAAIGSDVALMSLYGISQKVKYKKLQEKAQDMIDHIAQSLELSSDQLADRLVPDLSLEENGSKVLDFGPRKFIVGFDEQLKPSIKDESGKPIKNLPKPGKKDDEEKAAQATTAWKALKKDVRAVASTQIQRLELAMCNCRRWTADVFREFLVNHPLVCHLTRRLIWGIYNGGGLKTTFRVAEDNSFADIHDEDFQLEKEAEIGIPHPIEFSGNVSAGWGTVFADYEILQPFPQLGREVYHLSDEYSETSTLDIVKGVKVPSGAIRGLESRGWRKGIPQDAGFIWEYKKPLPGGFELELELDPGISAGGYDSEFDEQTLGLAILRKAQQQVNFKELAPIVYSELFRDLILLKS